MVIPSELKSSSHKHACYNIQGFTVATHSVEQKGASVLFI